MDFRGSFGGSTAMILVIVLSIWWISAFATRRWRQNQLARKNRCRPPPKFPQYDIILALDLIYANITAARKHKSLEANLRYFSTYGHTYRTQRFRTSIIMTCEPENVKTVLSLSFGDYGMAERRYTFGPLLGQGIFTSDGEQWSQSRHMIRPNFARDQLANLNIFENLMVDMLALIPTDGRTVDLQDLFFKFTIDSATEFLFGHSVHSLKRNQATDAKEVDIDFATAFNYAQANIVTNTRLGPLRALHFNRKARRCNQTCHRMVEEFVDRALKVREKAEDVAEDCKRYLFLDGLARHTGDRKRIRDELMNVLLAGRDTTASLLSNMFFMLAKHPDIWNKLRAEIATLNGCPPTYEQLRGLKYLRQCINESLRLHPVVPVNSRTAVTDTILPVGGGPDGCSPVFVPKGTIVSYSVWAMHRRAEFFGPDVQEYRPERWDKLRLAWEYLPFNGGPRICIGQQYALTEAAYVTVRLLQEFSILESRDPGPWEENLTLTLCSRHGTKVSLQR